MKRIMILSSMALMCMTLLASVDVGALKLREDNNFWRLTHSQSSSSGSGGWGSDEHDYYYNYTYPSALDSMIYVSSDDLNDTTSKDLYTRVNFADHYEICIDSFWADYGYPAQMYQREIQHYNLQDQMTDKFVYYQDSWLIPIQHIQYNYDALGNVIAEVTRGSGDQITNFILMEYDTNNRMLLQDKYEGNAEPFTHLEQTQNFYGSYAIPDSTHLWRPNTPSYIITRTYNTFDDYGNVILKVEKGSGKEIHTSKDFILGEGMYFPLHELRYTLNLYNGNWSVTDTLNTFYMYSPDFRVVNFQIHENSLLRLTQTLHYSNAWCLLYSQYNFYGDYAWDTMTSSSSYTWEFFTTPNDDPVQTTVPALSAYPNPCRDNTTLEYLLKDSSAVTMNIYNIKGQKVLSQSLGTKSSGTHDLNITLDKNVFASGIYFVRLTTQHDTKNLKLIVIK